jgi:hypothetical protein
LFIGNENESFFTLQEFSIAFADNLLQIGIGPFGIHLQNDVMGVDRVSLAGADDTGYALFNGEIVRSVASISLVDVDGTAFNSVALSGLPALASFEHKRLQFSLTGYFDPLIPSTFDGELVSVSQTPAPAALPLFASALFGGGILCYFKRRSRSVRKARQLSPRLPSPSPPTIYAQTLRIGPLNFSAENGFLEGITASWFWLDNNDFEKEFGTSSS